MPGSFLKVNSRTKSRQRSLEDNKLVSILVLVLPYGPKRELPRFREFSKRRNDILYLTIMLTVTVARLERNESRRAGSGPWRYG
jgi:hypothetical protein